MGEEAYGDNRAAITNPTVVHGMIEDYRAGLVVDHQHDKADRVAGKRVQCPTLVLWSLRDDLERLYGDVLSIWRHWTTVLEGHGIDSGHHMAEEAPHPLVDAIATFLAKTKVHVSGVGSRAIGLPPCGFIQVLPCSSCANGQSARTSPA